MIEISAQKTLDSLVMGGSKRHRKNKQKDFAKAKLRVGKKAPGRQNLTDTTFKAKNITLNQKKIGGLDSAEALKRKLSILRKPTQNLNSRKEIMMELVEGLDKHYDGYVGDMDDILKVSNILVLDRSRKMRELNLNLWKWLVESGKISLLTLHLNELLLFVNSAMTHLSPGVRTDSIKSLACLLSSPELADLTVKSSWYKLLHNFMILMNWSTDKSGKTQKNLVIREDSADLEQKDLVKIRIDQLKVLGDLIHIGCFEEPTKESKADQTVQIHPLVRCYMIPTKPEPFRSLRLFTDVTFGVATDLETVATDDLANRRKVLLEGFGEGLEGGLRELQGEDNKELANRASALLQDIGLVREEYTD